MGEAGKTNRSTQGRRGRVVAAIGGALHIAVPQLLVLRPRLDGPTVDPSITTWVLAIIGIAAVLGASLAGRLPAIGRTFVATAAFVSTFGVLWQFQPGAYLLAGVLLTAVGLLFASDPLPRPSVESRRAVVGSMVIGGYIVWRLVSGQLDKYGPTHPESNVAARDRYADWLWLGAVGPTTATVSAGGLAPGAHALSFWDGAGDPTTATTVASRNGVARFELAELTPGTNYTYRVHASDEPPRISTGGVDDVTSFATPVAGAQNLTIAFGSCARTASNGAVFDAIRATEPDLFVQLGDLHYGNLASDRPADHVEVLGRSLSTPAQSALYSSVPSAWIWDDHDYGPNNSDSSSPGRDAVLTAYREAVPHWAVDPDPTMPINQAFTIGRVRVITSDTRSHRTSSTMLGAAQEAWLIDELVASAQTHALVVWAMPTPWIFPDIAGSDVWGGFPDERRRIANAIANAGITNLVMISGDWHHAAIDDGTNTNYSDDDGFGFPMIHAAPLDRPGARTNLPYSHGVFSNAGQFGTIEVLDDGGSTIDVTLCAHLWTGERMGELPLRFDVLA